MSRNRLAASCSPLRARSCSVPVPTSATSTRRTGQRVCRSRSPATLDASCSMASTPCFPPSSIPTFRSLLPSTARRRAWAHIWPWPVISSLLPITPSLSKCSPGAGLCPTRSARGCFLASSGSARRWSSCCSQGISPPRKPLISALSTRWCLQPNSKRPQSTGPSASPLARPTPSVSRNGWSIRASTSIEPR